MAALPFPEEALHQHVALLGKTRSGKSSAMRVIVEGLLDAGEPVCIIDPKGDWWGLKLASDGKHPGYPVVIFGGEHADVPINAHAGAHVAELFATGNRPCLIDRGGGMVGERTRFWIDFASTLFRLTRGHRYLVVDEIHNFAPKGQVMSPDAGKALHWTNRLASEGLGKGIVMLFASQRPQKVHNDTLTSAETLIAMRVLHPSDRSAIADWIKGCGDMALGAKVLDSLAQMPRGEGWVWSPEIGFGPERVQFPMFKTYDSFRAQTAEEAAGLEGWAMVDLEDVKAKLSAVVEEAEANDPKRLKAEIERLRKDAGKAAPAATDPAVLAAEYERGLAAGFKGGRTEGFALGLRLSREALEGLRLPETSEDGGRPAHAAPAPTSAAARPHPVAAPVRPAPPRDGTPLTAPQSRVLEALGFWLHLGFEQPTRAQVGAAAGYSPSSGGFANLLGQLRVAGMVDYPAPNCVGLTIEGGRCAPAADGRSAVDRARSLLAAPQMKVFNAILERPKGASRAEIAEATGYSATSGGFANLLGSMRTIGLIDYPSSGQVRVADWLSP